MRVHHRPLIALQAGFSLIEVLLAASIGCLISVVAADAMLTHLRTNERLEATERLRNDWSRTTHFIESEVALSERVLTDANSISLNQCGSTISPSDFRFALELRRDLAPAIYYTKANASTEAAEWLGDRSLWRCGPSIGSDGNYSGAITGSSYTISNERLVDGLTSSCSLTTTASASGSSKSLTYNLCIKGLTGNGYSQSVSSQSRISPVFSYPTATSLCSNKTLSIEGFYKLGGGTASAETLEVPQGAVPANQDVLICGYGGGDTITGSTANDVLEGGDKNPETAGATIDGQAGNDRLRGTMAGDLLIGGPGDDILVGWDGNDLLIGENQNGSSSDPAGENRYLPGLGNDRVQGGSGLDVVFLDGVRNNYTGLSACSRSNCSLSYGANGVGYTLSTTGVEVLIFRDGRYDLN